MRYGLGLGLLTGSFENAYLATTLRLDMSFTEAASLASVSVVIGGLFGSLLGGPIAVLCAPLTERGRLQHWMASRKDGFAMGVMALVLSGFYAFPASLQVFRDGRVLAAVATLALPLPITGLVFVYGRYVLRRIEIGVQARMSWFQVSAIAAIGIGLVTSAFLATRDRDPSGAVAGDPNIIVITIDTLRRDHLSAYGEKEAVPTPNFDAFAKAGVLYNDAITPLPETGPAHASLFTGLHPVQHGVLANSYTLSRRHETLAEIVGKEGYATAAFVSSFAVDARSGLDQGFQTYDDDFFQSVRGLSDIRLVGLALKVILRFGDPQKFPQLLERSAPDTNALALRWASAHADVPVFLWVHYFEPHTPYERYDDVDDGLDPRWILSHEREFTYTEDVIKKLRARYAQEVEYVDSQLGELLAGLGDLGLTDNALVMITADHGESLGEHGIHFNHHGLYDEVIRVPLALQATGLRAGTQVVEPQVRLMDLTPTALDFVKIAVPEGLDGVELLGYAERLRKHSVVGTLMGRKTGSLSQGTLYGLRTGSDKGHVKYILDPDSASQALYDLTADPDELENVATAQADAAKRSRRLVEGTFEGIDIRDEILDDATQKRLEALGYME
jgi:arylsulfatase A-like enzyme